MNIYTIRDNDNGAESEALEKLEYELMKRGIRKCSNCKSYKKGINTKRRGWLCNDCNK